MTETQRSRGIPAHLFWPGMVVALLGLSVTMVTITVIAATGDPSFAVEKDYYERAQSWDDRKALEQSSVELGWSIEVSVGEPSAIGRRPLVLDLDDASGEPIEGARIEVEHFHHATANRLETITLVETEVPGRYAAPSRIDRTGFWELRMRAEVGDTVFVHDRTLDLYSL